jgi:hypothetical protein
MYDIKAVIASFLHKLQQNFAKGGIILGHFELSTLYYF